MMLIDSFTPESPPVGNVLRGDVFMPPPPMVDSSSCISYLHDHEKNHDEEGGETSSAAVEAMARVFFPLTPDPTTGFLAAKQLGAAPAQPERKIQKEKKGASEREIKKTLTKSDFGHLSRLLIPRACVTTHVLPSMDEERVRRVKSGKGADVGVWDADTRTEHGLVFAYWASSGSYILKGCWTKEFVRGIYWDPIASKFHFSLLRKAN
ncbi:hypothetical protein BT93_E1344 [Corymbia citriodora subsp. variegata]|nr:hypothetical protein BT93_E1344 [Corymbia citriodora subsp. variegata]